MALVENHPYPPSSLPQTDGPTAPANGGASRSFSLSPLSAAVPSVSSVSSALVAVWTDPIAGRDEGLALIGKRVRCILPKLSPDQKRRVLEGLIVRLPDHAKQQQQQPQQQQQQRPIKVELLIDKSMLQYFPFLPVCTEEGNDDTDRNKKASNHQKTSVVSDVSRRNAKLEQLIRGNNKVTIKIKLANRLPPLPGQLAGIPWAILKLVPAKLLAHTTTTTTPTTATTRSLTSLSSLANTVAATKATITTIPEEEDTSTTSSKGERKRKLAVRSNNANQIPNGEQSALTTSHHAPVTVAGADTTNGSASVKKKRKTTKSNSNKNASIQHVGDGNDPPEQQVANWRWLASRYHDTLLYSSLFHNQNHTSNTNDNDEALLNNIVDDAGQALGPAVTRAVPSPYTVEMLSAGFIGQVVKVQAAPKPSSSSSSSAPCKTSAPATLAMVTIRRLILPEQTCAGRLPHHGISEVFEDADNMVEGEEGDAKPHFLLQLPIEQLVVVARHLVTTSSETKMGATPPKCEDMESLYASRYYSFKNNAYTLLGKNSINTLNVAVASVTKDVCHRCRRSIVGSDLVPCQQKINCQLLLNSSWCSELQRKAAWCKTCIQMLSFRCQPDTENAGSTMSPPCCIGLACDCRICTSFRSVQRNDEYVSSVAALKTNNNQQLTCSGQVRDFFAAMAFAAESAGVVDFDLPDLALNCKRLPKPLAQPSNRIKTKVPKRKQKESLGNVGTPKAKASRPLGKSTEKKNGKRTFESDKVGKLSGSEDYNVVKPTCARLLPYDASNRRLKLDSDAICSNDRPRNLRPLMLKKKAAEPEKEVKPSGRAARANQRRLMKDVFAIGSSSLGVDTLAQREPKLRFSRSGIHAWGVFADEDIGADEMVIEYRGELISNAVAEKRERLYNIEKIGSDYMFRIDATQVCDATKQGNVARFINASCEPNCYTKIITLDGNKRIVIYAKRDIAAGEELCYDYKFPLEYDESKRVPCHCGARDCRGFMNWVCLISG